MHLLYLTFGTRTEVHSQAAFSIFSFLKENTLLQTINIITDQPGFYNHLQSTVNVIPLLQTELKEWEGDYQFFWRVKIKAIEKVCSLYPNSPVVYLDSDTFLNRELSYLQNILTSGKALMHQNEGILSGKKSKTEKKMWQQIQGKLFGNLTMQPTDCMWNAGVVAIPNTHKNEENRLALAICDEMCRQGVTPRLIEQYALSLALEKVYGLQEAQHYIVHYWQVKEIWNEHIHQFFLKAHFHQWPFKEVIQQASQFSFLEIPIALRIRSTNRRLKKWVDKLWPAKNPIYLLTHPKFH